jgi:hypothetical protein
MDACSNDTQGDARGSGGAPSESGGQLGTAAGGSSQTGGSGGDGHVGTGGENAGGAAGVAGAGEAGAVEVGGGACLPEELAELVAPCQFAEECSYSTTDSGFLTTCYANGVKTQFIAQFAMSTTIVKSPSGSLCYVLDSIPTSGLEPNRYDYVWKDAALVTVATGSIETSMKDVLIVNVAGIRYRIELASEVCRGISALPLGTERCEQGACSP